MFCRLLAPLLMLPAAAAQTFGIFDSHQDVGVVLTPGTAAYDAAAQTYTLSASGENMWATADAFQFAWKKVSGDARLSADVSFVGQGGDPHRKAVLIVRQSLDADSPYADVAVHGVGLTSLQAREEKGAATHEVQANINGPARVAIEKRGSYFYMYVAGASEELHFAGGSMRVPIEGSYYVGIGVCAHNKDAVEKAVFSHVQFSDRPSGALASFSTIETVTVSSTDARVTMVSAKQIESPVWIREGDLLAYRSEGRTYRVPAAGGASVAAPDVPAGEERYFTSAKSGTMQVWRKLADGSGEEQVTHDDFSNWYPRLSPDGLRLAVISAGKGATTAPRNTDVMLRVITLATGRTAVIAKFIGGEGSLGASPWSPDGRRLVFVSYQRAPR